MATKIFIGIRLFFWGYLNERVFELHQIAVKVIIRLVVNNSQELTRNATDGFYHRLQTCLREN